MEQYNCIRSYQVLLKEQELCSLREQPNPFETRFFRYECIETTTLLRVTTIVIAIVFFHHWESNKIYSLQLQSISTYGAINYTQISFLYSSLCTIVFLILRFLFDIVKPQNTGDELKCFGRASSSFYTVCTRLVILANNPMICHESRNEDVTYGRRV